MPPPPDNDDDPELLVDEQGSEHLEPTSEASEMYNIQTESDDTLASLPGFPRGARVIEHRSSVVSLTTLLRLLPNLPDILGLMKG